MTLTVQENDNPQTRHTLSSVLKTESGLRVDFFLLRELLPVFFTSELSHLSLQKAAHKWRLIDDCPSFPVKQLITRALPSPSLVDGGHHFRLRAPRRGRPR